MNVLNTFLSKYSSPESGSLKPFGSIEGREIYHWFRFVGFYLIFNENDRIKLKEENEMILHAIEIYVRFIQRYNSHEEAVCIFNREREKLKKKEKKWKRKKIVTLHKIFKKLSLSPSCIISIIRLLDNIG